MNNIMSLPRNFVVPANWTQTPDQDNISPVAQSLFANWKDEPLTTLSITLTIGKVVSAIGIGTSLCLSSIPGTVLCGTALVVCFIGERVIRREQIARCQHVCLQIEHWCIQFRKAAEELIKSTKPFIENKSLRLDSETIQHLSDTVNELPDNNLKDLQDTLLKQHLNLFGKERSIGQGIYRSAWIDVYFHAFLSKITHAYISCSTFQEYTSGDDRIEDANPPNSIRTQAAAASVQEMYDYFSPNTATLADEAENWRRSVAAFRSSLS